jgi:hypothetical protein
MINRHSATKSSKLRVIASFGGADLVKINRSNYELRGASEEERTAAKEWVSLFMHEACLEFRDAEPQSRATSNSRWKVSSLGRSA